MKKAASAAASASMQHVSSRNNSTVETSNEVPDGDILKQAKNKYYLKREHLNLAASPQATALKIVEQQQKTKPEATASK